eukprot:489120-Karenia_brevis.AAC.1
MAALQAVVAEQLKGDTLHHCCGLKRGVQDLGASSKRQSDVAKSILHWRWLIIDEVSMLSSQLLAEIDCKLRDVVRKLGTIALALHDADDDVDIHDYVDDHGARCEDDDDDDVDDDDDGDEDEDEDED